MNMFAGARAFKDMFDEAMQGGCVEVRVMFGGRTIRARVVSCVLVGSPFGCGCPTCVCVAEFEGFLTFSKLCICGFRYGNRQHKASCCLRERLVVVALLLS